jgi:hypothetical protein
MTHPASWYAEAPCCLMKPRRTCGAAAAHRKPTSQRWRCSAGMWFSTCMAPIVGLERQVLFAPPPSTITGSSTYHYWDCWGAGCRAAPKLAAPLRPQRWYAHSSRKQVSVPAGGGAYARGLGRGSGMRVWAGARNAAQYHGHRGQNNWLGTATVGH